MLDGPALGRFAETARLVLAALRDGPRQHILLFDQVRALDGPVGPGTLYGAVARLERLGLIEPTTNGGGRRAYRLIGPGRVAELPGTQEGIEGMSRLVRLYPGAWRARYGDEFSRLIEERPTSLADRIDIVRGAVDAQLHPHVLVGGPEPAPWTHRLPGLLALSAGLALTVGLLGIAFGPGPDWGAGGELLGIAFVLMLISVPGDYLAPFGRRIAVGFGCIAVGIASASVSDWWGPAVAGAIVAELVAVSGLLAMAAMRAGVGASRRWLLVAAAVLSPVFLIGAHALLRAATGFVLVPDGSSLASLSLLPYGLAWLLVGLRMTVRGSATITDPPIDPTAAHEVQTA